MIPSRQFILIHLEVADQIQPALQPDKAKVWQQQFLVLSSARSRVAELHCLICTQTGARPGPQVRRLQAGESLTGTNTPTIHPTKQATRKPGSPITKQETHTPSSKCIRHFVVYLPHRQTTGIEPGLPCLFPGPLTAPALFTPARVT